jgi:hypothetical protein
VTYPAFESHRLNGLVPRISGVYDVFGTGKTAIKLAYGRYSYNAGTMTNANSMLAGFFNRWRRRRSGIDGTARCHSCPTRPTCSRPPAAPTGSLDPDLHLPYTDEFVVGVDQQVASDTTVRFNYVRSSNATA